MLYKYVYNWSCYNVTHILLKLTVTQNLKQNPKGLWKSGVGDPMPKNILNDAIKQKDRNLK
jgi:hypothetical protein